MAVRTTKGATRFYFKEEDPGTKYPGVTSIVGMTPKPFLNFWNARTVAELAADSLDYLALMHERGGREAVVDYLRGAPTRYTKLRSGIGSDAHDLFERMIRGEHVGRVHPDMEPYRRHFAEFLDAVQPELVRAEDVAWSDTHRYAGSFDAILRVRLDDKGRPDPNGDPAVVMTDWKTSKSTYPEVALQMSAYAHADKLIDPAGNEEPMPEFDGACVLHITDSDWSFKPVRIDQDDVFAHFLHLRQTLNWVRDVSKTVLGDPIAERSGGALVTGTQRRA